MNSHVTGQLVLFHLIMGTIAWQTGVDAVEAIGSYTGCAGPRAPAIEAVAANEPVTVDPDMRIICGNCEAVGNIERFYLRDAQGAKVQIR